MHRIRHLEAEFGADLEDDGLEHAFGVEQGAVHIEDDGLERREAQDVALGFHPARYRAIWRPALGGRAKGWDAALTQRRPC